MDRPLSFFVHRDMLGKQKNSIFQFPLHIRSTSGFLFSKWQDTLHKISSSSHTSHTNPREKTYDDIHHLSIAQFRKCYRCEGKYEGFVLLPNRSIQVLSVLGLRVTNYIMVTQREIYNPCKQVINLHNIPSGRSVQSQLVPYKFSGRRTIAIYLFIYSV